MTTFELRKTEKIIVHELIEMEQVGFVNMILNNHKDNAIWANGMLMYVVPMEPSDEMLHAIRDGQEEHIYAIYYVEKSDYFTELQSTNGMKISVTAAEGKIFNELVAWIREVTQ
jgi:hypothetical protein